MFTVPDLNVTSTSDPISKASPAKWAHTIVVGVAMGTFLVISFTWRCHQRRKARRKIQEDIINSWYMKRPFSSLYGQRSESEVGGISYMPSLMVYMGNPARVDVGYMGNGNIDSEDEDKKVAETENQEIDSSPGHQCLDDNSEEGNIGMENQTSGSVAESEENNLVKENDGIDILIENQMPDSLGDKLK